MALALRTSGMSLQQTRTVRASRAGARRPLFVRAATGTPFPRNWLNKQPIVPVLGFFGWTIPANIPVSAFGGNSLFGLFTQSIGENLAHFPVGPALTDRFWLYLITYHVGLFLTIFLGQIGVNGRKQGYFQ